MDPLMKEERETGAEILELVEKKPYPTKETVQLARFVDSCFFVIEEVKKEELKKKQEQERIRKLKEEEQRKKAEEFRRQKELEAMAPIPEKSEAIPPLLDLPQIPTLAELGLEDLPNPTKPALAKREYVLQVYNNPIGILVEKEADGRYLYKIIEPYLEPVVIEKARDMYGKEFERDNSLFDNVAFLKRVAEKVTTKLGLPYTDLIPEKIHYYLERDILGAGIFDPLLYDFEIKEILCEGLNKKIKINYAGLGFMETTLTVTDNEILNRFIKRLANAAGKTLNEQNPILDTTFEGFKFEGTIGMGGGSSRIIIKRLERNDL